MNFREVVVVRDREGVSELEKQSNEEEFERVKHYII